MHSRPNLHGRGCRDAARPHPPLPLQLSQLCYLQLVPGKAGFRSEVRSQAPAPANPLSCPEKASQSVPGDTAAASGVDGPAPAWDGRPGPVSDSQWLPRTPWPHVSPFPTWTPACYRSRGPRPSCPCSLQGCHSRLVVASLMQHPLSQPTLIWFGCSLSSLLSERPPGWVSANGAGGREAKLPGDRPMREGFWERGLLGRPPPC